MGQREHPMEIAAWQQFLPAIIEPLFFDDGLAFGTMTVPAGVIGRAFKPAMIAFFHMPPSFAVRQALTMFMTLTCSGETEYSR